MGHCPKCQAPVDQELTVCPACGAVLQPGADGGGTLDVDKHFDELSASEDSVSTFDSQASGRTFDPLAATFESITPTSSAPTEPSEESIGTWDSADQLPSSNQPSVGSPGVENDVTLFQESLPLPTASNAGKGDEAGTLPLPDDAVGEGIGATAAYNTQELQNAREGKGSGTAGRLQRLWRGAAGSSENPGHSLRSDEPQASDSVFNRVATRRVAEAHVADESADYRILEKLGEGAMGIVYSARQTAVDRLVALKAIKASHQGNEESRRKFFYEAQITADLDHPHIVPIHELGQTGDGLLFYVMKRIVGTEWKDVIRQKTRDENLDIFMKVADAIAFAHSKDVIHRDLKPENTMLGDFGEVYVTDWGLAVNLRKKRPFSLGGTPIYMAPEMAGHVVDKIGPASDVYLLGAILFQIVTGVGPHTGKTVRACLNAAFNNEIIPYAGDDPLIEIARKAMATEPVDRYASVEALQVAIRQYQAHSESVRITERSHDVLAAAKAQKDYEKFARAQFGFQEAIELWPENAAAIDGLKAARLAYGQCAFERGNFDLVLQTVDRTEPEEQTLYSQAVKAKAEADSRVKKLARLRKIAIGAVAAGILVSSGFAIVALIQRNAAREQRDLANEAADRATKSEQDANEQRELAEKNEKDANEQRELAVQNAKVANEQRELAEKSEKDANEQREKVVAKNKEIEGQNVTLKKQYTQIQEQYTQIQKLLTNVKLSGYQTKVALAKSQVENFTLSDARKNLSQGGGLADAPKELSKEQVPQYNAWGYKRVSLLTNASLPQTQLTGQVLASAASASDNGLAAVATKVAQGSMIQLLRYIDGKIELGKSLPIEGEVTGLAISPQGDELAISFRGDELQGGLLVWNPNSNAGPQTVTAVDNRPMQGISYSGDGKLVMAGINEGLWIWNRQENWFTQARPSARIKDIRGQLKSLQIQLKSLQMLDQDRALIVSEVNGQLEVSVAELKSGTSLLVTFPNEIRARLTSAAHTLVGSQLLTGVGDEGRLYLWDLRAPSTTRTASSGERTDRATYLAENPRELPKKHTTRIKSIIAAGGKLLATVSDEPVIHIWSANTAGVNYDAAMYGTEKNIRSAAFMDADKILGVDELGLGIVWNIRQQKQRVRMERLTADDNLEPTAAPVVGLFSSDDSRQAWSIDKNGGLERWDLTTGKTVRFADGRWNFIGHTPGAQFVDAAVDTNAGVLVTSARIKRAEATYLNEAPSPDQRDHWEFCVWDLASGQMRNRWREPNRPIRNAERMVSQPSPANTTNRESIEQRVTLLDQGRLLLLSSDNETILTRLDGSVALRKEGFGTYFAVAHPTRPNLLALVKRSGAIRLFDYQQPTSWDDQALRQYALASSNDVPFKAAWNARGDRFYLAFATGGLAAFGWQNDRLQLLWSQRSLEDDDSNPLWKALSGTRVKSHNDVDIAVQQAAGADRVHVAKRGVGKGSTTRVVTVDFPANGQPRLVQEDTRGGPQWLTQSSAGTWQLTSQLHDKLAVDSAQIAAYVQRGDLSFISNNSGSVYRLTASSTETKTFGREHIKSATSDRQTRVIYVQTLESGEIWTIDLTGDAPEWTHKEGWGSKDIARIILSPDGQRLATLSTNQQLQIIDTTSGKPVGDIIPAVAAVAWDDQTSSSLALVFADGRLEMLADGRRQAIDRKFALAPGASISSLNFFVETFSNPQAQALRYFLIQSEDDAQGRIDFVALKPQKQENPEQRTVNIERGTNIVCSPVDGTFITGNSKGTVKVWYATPTIDVPLELFDLQGHRGSPIQTMKFAADGKTLLTGDGNGTIYGWLSEEPNPLR